MICLLCPPAGCARRQPPHGVMRLQACAGHAYCRVRRAFGARHARVRKRKERLNDQNAEPEVYGAVCGTVRRPVRHYAGCDPAAPAVVRRREMLCRIGVGRFAACPLRAVLLFAQGAHRIGNGGLNGLRCEKIGKIGRDREGLRRLPGIGDGRRAGFCSGTQDARQERSLQEKEY